MIRFENVSKWYGAHQALKDLTFEIPEGETCVLLGPSGCGKSTTLRLINRLLIPEEGSIYVRGKSVEDFVPEKLRRSMGYVIQSIGLLPHLTVEDNISLVPSLLKWPADRKEKRTEELLEMIGLAPGSYRRKYPHQLSGGEAQRIGVARALAADPPILLMDEPFGAVDPLNRESLQNEFLAIQRDLRKTVIFVTHDLEEAIRLGDRIAIMKDGVLQQYDSPPALLSRPANRFVREFIGHEGPLKLLNYFRTEDYMIPVEPLNEQDRLDSDLPTHPADPPVLWVVNSRNGLTGMIDRRNGGGRGNTAGEAMMKVSPEQIGISPRASLKEALSRLLGRGIPSIPVLGEQDRLLGEIRLSAIENLPLGKENS